MDIFHTLMKKAVAESNVIWKLPKEPEMTGLCLISTDNRRTDNNTSLYITATCYIYTYWYMEKKKFLI